jgi:regulatory protein
MALGVKGRRSVRFGAGGVSAPRPGASSLVVAIRLLARREYSRTELAQRLARRGGNRAEVERALDELERKGYLSDARCASGIVARQAGHFARRAIAQRLKAAGVAPPAASSALAALEGRDEVAEATALWQRRFGSAPRDEREKARQVRFLLSRGYTVAIAFKVLRAAGAPAGEEIEAD